MCLQVNAVNVHVVFVSKMHHCMNIKVCSSNTCSIASIVIKIGNEFVMETNNFKIKDTNVGWD